MSHAAAYLDAITKQLRREQDRRDRTARVWSADSVVTNDDGDVHEKQLAFIRDANLYQIALCSRRAGKSVANCAKLAFAAMAKPGRVFLYFGATKPSVWLLIWEPVWKEFCRKWKLPVDHNSTRMVSTFENGSVIAFTGTDDVKHVETYLGGNLGGAVIDEAQSQPDSLLVPLATRILPNALLDKPDDAGFLVMSGTIPDVATGYFMRTWKAARWSRHNWNRFENVFLRGQSAALDQLLKANPGFSITSPEIRREWFGEFKFDPAATAYRYDADLNGYDPTPPAWFEELPPLPDAPLEKEGAIVMPACRMAALPFTGVDRFTVGVDPGTRDRWSIQVRGWGAGCKQVQHVVDWTAPRNAGMGWSLCAEVLAVIERHLHPEAWFYDAQGSNAELDTFAIDYGVPVIKAARKTDMPGQVRRDNALLTSGTSAVMRGSALEADYQNARWDADARGKGQYRFAAGYHPDASEANRYALAGYYDAFAPTAPPPTAPQRMRRELEKRQGRNRQERDAQRMGVSEVDIGDIWSDD